MRAAIIEIGCCTHRPWKWKGSWDDVGVKNLFFEGDGFLEEMGVEGGDRD
jgi:hypothetical protein